MKKASLFASSSFLALALWAVSASVGFAQGLSNDFDQALAQSDWRQIQQIVGQNPDIASSARLALLKAVVTSVNAGNLQSAAQAAVTAASFQGGSASTGSAELADLLTEISKTVDRVYPKPASDQDPQYINLMNALDALSSTPELAESIPPEFIAWIDGQLGTVDVAQAALSDTAQLAQLPAVAPPSSLPVAARASVE